MKTRRTSDITRTNSARKKTDRERQKAAPKNRTIQVEQKSKAKRKTDTNGQLKPRGTTVVEAAARTRKNTVANRQTSATKKNNTAVQYGETYTPRGNIATKGHDTTTKNNSTDKLGRNSTPVKTETFTRQQTRNNSSLQLGGQTKAEVSTVSKSRNTKKVTAKFEDDKRKNPNTVSKGTTTPAKSQVTANFEENIRKSRKTVSKTQTTAVNGQKCSGVKESPASTGKTPASKQKTLANKTHTMRGKLTTPNTGKPALSPKKTTAKRTSVAGNGATSANKNGTAKKNNVASKSKTTANSRNTTKKNNLTNQDTATTKNKGTTKRSTAARKSTTANNRDTTERGKESWTRNKHDLGRALNTAAYTKTNAANTENTSAREKSVTETRIKNTDASGQNTKPTAEQNAEEKRTITIQEKVHATSSKLEDSKQDTPQMVVILTDLEAAQVKHYTPQTTTQQSLTSGPNSPGTDDRRKRKSDDSLHQDAVDSDAVRGNRKPKRTKIGLNARHSNNGTVVDVFDDTATVVELFDPEPKQTAQKTDSGRKSVSDVDQDEEGIADTDQALVLNQTLEASQPPQKSNENPLSVYDFHSDEEVTEAYRPYRTLRSFSDRLQVLASELNVDSNRVNALHKGQSENLDWNQERREMAQNVAGPGIDVSDSAQEEVNNLKRKQEEGNTADHETVQFFTSEKNDRAQRSFTRPASVCDAKSDERGSTLQKDERAVFDGIDRAKQIRVEEAAEPSSLFHVDSDNGSTADSTDNEPFPLFDADRQFNLALQETDEETTQANDFGSVAMKTEPVDTDQLAEQRKERGLDTSVLDCDSDVEEALLQSVIAESIALRSSSETDQTRPKAERRPSTTPHAEEDLRETERENLVSNLISSNADQKEKSDQEKDSIFNVDSHEGDTVRRAPVSRLETKQTGQRTPKMANNFFDVDADDEDPLKTKPVSGLQTKETGQKTDKMPNSSFHVDSDVEQAMERKSAGVSVSHSPTKEMVREAERRPSMATERDSYIEEAMLELAIAESLSLQFHTRAQEMSPKAGPSRFSSYTLDSGDEDGLQNTSLRPFAERPATFVPLSLRDSDSGNKVSTKKKAKEPTIAFDSDLRKDAGGRKRADESKNVFKSNLGTSELAEKQTDEPSSGHNFTSKGSWFADLNWLHEKRSTEVVKCEPVSVFDTHDSTWKTSSDKTVGWYGSKSLTKSSYVRPLGDFESDSDVEFLGEEKVGEPIIVLDSDSELSDAEEMQVVNTGSKPEKNAQKDPKGAFGFTSSDEDIADYGQLNGYNVSPRMGDSETKTPGRKPGARKRKRKGRGKRLTAKKRKPSKRKAEGEGKAGRTGPGERPGPAADLFFALPWDHLIWHRLLRCLSLVDKFRLRAVNRNCKEVVERHFQVAQSIEPSCCPQMSRLAWTVLVGKNRCARKLVAPVLEAGGGDDTWQPFSNDDLKDVLKKNLPLTYLSLSYTRVRLTYALLKSIIQRFPDLEQLHVQDICQLWTGNPDLFRTDPCCLKTTALIALTRLELTRIHTLDLSRNVHDITTATLHKLVQTQKSLRELAIDAKPIVETSRYSLLELGKIWLGSDLQRLMLTRAAVSRNVEHVLSVFSSFYCDSNRWFRDLDTLTLTDICFIKETRTDGSISRKLLFSECFHEERHEGYMGRQIAQDAMKKEGVEVGTFPCSSSPSHLYRRLRFLKPTVCRCGAHVCCRDFRYWPRL